MLIMLKQLLRKRLIVPLLTLLLVHFAGTSFAQRTLPPPVSGDRGLGNYVLFAEGSHYPVFDSLRYGVEIDNHSTVSAGDIGSNSFVNIGSFNQIFSDIHSGNRINVGDQNTLSGNIVARNDAFVNFPVINVSGPGTQIVWPDAPDGTVVQARGNIRVDTTSDNSVDGPVYLQRGYTYVGPFPSNGSPIAQDPLPLPTLPALPLPITFPAPGTKDITGSARLSPGVYNDLVLEGDAIVTFTEPGIYVFRSIKTTGSNTFNYQMSENIGDTYRIYVHEEVDLGSTEVLINGQNFDDAGLNAPNRIYCEVHGAGTRATGGYAFRLDDRGPRQGPVSWGGTVYATRGSIGLGGFDRQDTDFPRTVVGAFWSKTKILVGNGMNIRGESLEFVPSTIEPYYPPPPGGKVGDKIGAELTSLFQYPDIVKSIPDNNLFRIDQNTGKVWIEVIAKEANNSDLLTFLQGNGWELVTSSPDKLVLTGKYPVANLQLLNGRGDIDHVRPLYEPINNAGQVATQGDATMHSDAVRAQFGVEGNGVTVGVISNSYNTLNQEAHDVQEGDLPNNVQNVLDLGTPNTDEGRAMAQIVHDVAPKANLIFRTGTISPLDFALGIKQLASPPYNANVIVDDITYLTEPFLTDGLVAQAVNDVVANNRVTYVTSAGNFGSLSYQGTFAPLPSASLPAGISGVAHDFGGGNSRQKLHLKKGTYTIVMHWGTQYYSLGGNPGAAVDLDFYIVKPDGTYFGFNRNNINADPIEVMPFNVNEETDADLIIVRANGSNNVPFKYIIFRGDATIVGHPGSSTIVGQANADSAITVGAMLYANVHNQVPDFPSVASFSSRGGTTVNGTTVRQKPDVTAPNGVNTTVTLSTNPIFNIEPDEFPNFFGTSASAPHAAGVAALLIEGKKKFDLQSTVKPAEVKTLLKTTALDLQGPGFDLESGAGAIQADAAMLTMANARPIITALISPPGLQPSNTTDFTLRVTGQYLNAATKVYVRGAAIPTVFVNSTEVTATVSGSISDDPPIQLYNPPKSPSGLDGGLSEALFLFSSRKAVVVKADSKTKKFGEPLPTFTFSVTVDGIPTNDPTILANLKLDDANVRFATFATRTSGIATYSITPSRRTPLNPANPTDAAIINQYNFLFLPGTLTVQKLPLKIRPHAQVVTYGEALDDLHYVFDFGNAAVSTKIKDSIKALYKKYSAANTLVVLQGLPAPYASEATSNMLNNLSTMASFQSVKGARKFLVQNSQMVPITGPITPDQLAAQRYLVDVSAEALTRFKTDSASIELASTSPEGKLRGLVSARALGEGTAEASLPGQPRQSLANGPLLSMVNGPLRAAVNGYSYAEINGVWQSVQDITIQEGQLMVGTDNLYVPVSNAQLKAVVNGKPVTLDLAMQNGQLKAVVNGQLMTSVNGQLQATVNGTLFTFTSGQLVAGVKGQLMPVVNEQLQVLVNGQLKPVVNGQLLAVVNGELVLVDYAVVENGQLKALVNGQLKALVNGQLLAAVNGQLLAAVNGALMAEVNGHITFTVFVSGQLKALVNGQLQVYNGQLKALVNGILQGVDSYTITSGQLKAIVNGQDYSLENGQLKALVNGQLKALVNDLGGVSPTNNASTAVVVDRDDLVLQGGALGGVFSANMITGLGARLQKLVPGGFFDPNLDVTYQPGKITVLRAPLTVDADWKVLNQGAPTPPQSFFTSTIKGLEYNDQPSVVTGIKYTLSPAYTGAPGVYTITPVVKQWTVPNYRPILLDTGRLYVNPTCGSNKKIKVKRECVRAATQAEVMQYGLAYVVTFSYDNKNATPLFIPHSAANFVTIDDGGKYRNSLPEVFEPGFHTVEVFFDGKPMKWELHSCSSVHTTATASSSNANSGACNPAAPSLQSTEMDDEDTKRLEEIIPVTTSSVYPNPARNEIRIHTEEAIVVESGVVVMDATGRIYPNPGAKRIDEKTLELKVSSLTPGVYTVQVKTGKGFRTLRFTKL